VIKRSGCNHVYIAIATLRSSDSAIMAAGPGHERGRFLGTLIHHASDLALEIAIAIG